MDQTSQQIARHLTIFGNAVTAMYTIYHDGTQLDEPSASLPRKLYDEPVPISGVVSAETAVSNDRMLRAMVNELSAWLVVSVRDTLEDTPLRGEPEYRFLKHVRNGLAHGNEFSFNYEISKTAWRGHEITEDMDGMAVISTVDSSSPFMHDAEWIEGYLEAGDIKELCNDILQMAVKKAQS